MEGSEITRVEYRPAVITADFAAMQAELDRALEPYQGVTIDAIQEMPEKDVKACAKDLRAMKRSLEDGRKGIKREYNRPLQSFEGEVRKLVAQIDAHLELFSEVESANEERRKENRMAVLRNAYVAFCVDNGVDSLVELVPAERLVERQWLNKSFAERKAVAGIEDRAAKVIGDWKQLHNLGLAHQDECEAVFFDTLELAAAISHDRVRTEQDQRVQAMREQDEAMRAEAEEYRDLEEELAELPQYADFDEPEDGPLPYVIHLSMTEAQKRQLMGWMRDNGVHGTIGRDDLEERGLVRVTMTEAQAEAFREWAEVA